MQNAQGIPSAMGFYSIVNTEKRVIERTDDE